MQRAWWREVGPFLKATVREFVEDKVPKQSAALAYYALFALGPLLVLAIGIASLAFGADAAREAVVGQFSRLTGEAGGKAIEDLLGGADRERVGLVGTAVGLVLLLFSAGAVFAQLKEALDRVWEVEARAPEGLGAKVGRAVRKNVVSFVGVLGTGFLLLVSLVLSAALAAAGERLSVAFPAGVAFWAVVNFAVALAVVTFLFACIFRFLPDARVAWRDVWVGAVVTSVLFNVGQAAIGLYLGAGPLGTAYGAASAILVLLVWVYYSSMILFFGAELTQVWANRYGSRVRPAGDAQPLTEAVLEKQDHPSAEGARRGEKRRVT